MSITEDVYRDHPFIMDVSSDYFAIWCNLIIGVFFEKIHFYPAGYTLTNIVIVVAIM